MRLLTAVLVVSLFASDAVARPGPWTTADLHDVAEAGVGTGKMDFTEVSEVRDLAQALKKAGDPADARALLLKRLERAPATGDSLENGLLLRDLVDDGGAADVEQLIDNTSASGAKRLYLCDLGAAKAQMGDAAGAIRAAAAIEGLKPDASAIESDDGCSGGLAEIGQVLAQQGAWRDAVLIAERQPTGMTRMRILSEVAYVLCAPTSSVGGDRDHGAQVAAEAGDSARAALAALPGGGTMLPRWVMIRPAASAIAACESPAAAQAFVYSLAPDTPARAANFAPPSPRTPAPPASTAPDEPDVLLQQAEERSKAGDKAGARIAALAASRAIRAESPAVRAKRPPGLGPDSDVSALLSELGEYDAAMETVKGEVPDLLAQYYATVVRAEIAHRDRAAVDRTLPTVISALCASSQAANLRIGLLDDITRDLGIAGYGREAWHAYARLNGYIAATATTGVAAAPYLKLELRAVLGDRAGAIAAALKLGPLTVQPDPMRQKYVAAFTLALALHRAPTLAEIDAYAHSLPQTTPTEEAGPASQALGAIAEDLAKAGDVAGALEADADFDAAPAAAVAYWRNRALQAIAEAQIRSDDPRAALATIKRLPDASLNIPDPYVRMRLLQQLAAIPPRP